jgi:hypothetical protein
MLADLLPSDFRTNDSLPMTLTLEECNLFIQLASQLKREILHLQRPDWPEDNPPPGTLLPNSVVRFLACCLGWHEVQIRTGWNTFGATVWKTADSDDRDAGSGTVSELFKRHGHAEKLGSYYLTSTLLVLNAHLFETVSAYHNLYPAHKKCSNVLCLKYRHGLLRRKDNPRKINVHTLHGSFIAYSIHLVCHGKDEFVES